MVVVNFGINQTPVDSTFGIQDTAIRLVHLNETAVNLQLGGQPAASSDRIPSTTTTKERALGVLRKQDRVHTRRTPSPEPRTQDLALTIRSTCGRLRAACEDYQIRVSEIDPDLVDVGPSVLRYKILLAPGEQGEKLRKQAENIARQLAAESIPVIDRLPGTNYMYLDLARPDRRNVILDPLLFGYSVAD